MNLIMPPIETMDEDLKKALQEHEQVLRLLKYRKKLNGLNFYVPNNVQLKFHQSKANTIIFCAGNRSGKSTAGAVELAWALTKNYPDWFPQERRFKGAIKARVATDKFFKIDAVIEPKLNEYLPKEEIWRIKRSPQGYMMKLITKDGSYVEFLTMEQDLMAFEGQDLDFFWGDEPVERRRFIASQRGLVDRGGLTILTFTPLIEPWMKEELVDKSDEKNISVFFADTRDNKFDIRGNPILKENDIKKFESLLTEDEKQTRLHGKFFHLRGMVYKELNPEVHFIKDFDYEKDYQNYPVICVLDPHDRLPHHLIWAVIDRTNDIIIMHESAREGTIAELSALIKATERYFGWKIIRRLIDPNFGRKPLLSTGLSVIEELAKMKVTFSEANDNTEAGRLKVKEYLHYDNSRPLDINNKPKLFFVRDKVPVTIRSMMNYQYDEWRSEGERDPKETEKPKDTHGADTVRYLCMSLPSFYQPQAYELTAAAY